MPKAPHKHTTNSPINRNKLFKKTFKQILNQCTKQRIKKRPDSKRQVFQQWQWP